MKEKPIYIVVFLVGVGFLLGGTSSSSPGDPGYSVAGAVLIGSSLIASAIDRYKK